MFFASMAVVKIQFFGHSNGQLELIQQYIEGYKKLKIIYILLSLPSLCIFTQNADAFNFSIFTLNRLPIPEDVIMLLFGAGIVGLIGLGRRKLKK
jgi:hypothetical protein